MIKLEDFIVHFEIPDEEGLIPIFEMFLELNQLGTYSDFQETDDLGKIPNETWFKKLKEEVSKFGLERYKGFISSEIEKLTRHQKAHNIWEKKREYDLNNGNPININKYVKGYEYGMDYTMPPAHYYFYSSQKSRYFKGMILSSVFVWDEEIEDKLVAFAMICPFLIAGQSQAPTGLYIKDICEVITRKSKNAKSNLVKIKSRQTYKRAIKLIEKYMNKID